MSSSVIVGILYILMIFFEIISMHFYFFTILSKPGQLNSFDLYRKHVYLIAGLRLSLDLFESFANIRVVFN